jgi:hypothetical protein
MNLGIDIGRVIIGPGDGPDDTSFIGDSLEDALRTPSMEGAFEAIRKLVDVFERRVWLISKCFPRVQDRTRRWLDHHGFYDKTGLRRDRVVFCQERPQKSVHCERLGIEYFIDDRLDVLEAMRGKVPHLFLFGEQRRPVPAADWFQPVAVWPDALQAVLERHSKRSGTGSPSA